MNRRPALSVTASVSVLLLLFLAPLVQQTAHATGPPYTWSGPAAAERSPNFDIVPSALQASNGTSWLAWQTYRYSSSRPDIVYKTLTNGVWGTVERFTSSGTNVTPALAQLNNGTIILFWALRTTGSYNLYYKRFSVDQFGVGSWSGSVRLTTTSLNDTAPSATVGVDGTLWLVWTRSNRTCTPTCSPEDRQLYYKTLGGSVWSAEVKLTSDANWNYGASVMVGKDGKVRVAWAKGSNILVNYQIHYTTYDGALWSPPTQVVSSSSPDEDPSIIQDRNGTIWLFWARQRVSGNTVYYVLYNKFSVNLGQTWSAEAQMSFAPSGVTSQTPAAVQSNMGSDKAVRVFFVTSLEIDYDIWVYASPNIFPVHDVRVPFLSPSTPIQYPGGMASVGQSPTVTIGVTVTNIGDSAETVQVNLVMGNTTSYNLGTLTGSVPLGGTVTFSFSWDTTGVAPARYRLEATATLAGETPGNAADSRLTEKNRIHIIPLGDLDQDGTVALTDVSVFFYDFGFSSTCGCPRWNPFADLNNTGVIDIIDVGVAVKNFGVTT